MATVNMAALSDEEIIGLIKANGPSKYFNELYRRYHQKVHDKCYGFVKDKNKAREMAEDVFSKCFEKLGGFKQLSSFSSWLYSITYNHCIDYYAIKRNCTTPTGAKKTNCPKLLTSL
ncbi:MAG: hypothetical protein HC896_07010 [Bacteroidales bacterium]|nr:hypothetical protein [Bacteroidales bacterium]